MHRIRLATIAAIAALGVGALFVPESSAQQKEPSKPLERTESAIALRNDMRKLWEDHITWTRCVIVSTAHTLPDLAPTTARLLENQDEIGDAIKPFYGDAAGEQLSTLLRQHIVGAAAILAAAKAGDNAAKNAAITAWYANADQIAVFLSTANPENWPLPMVRAALRQHLDLTLQEATARLGGNYPADIDAYDAVHTQILGLSDVLSLGLINQFPHEFRGR